MQDKCFERWWKKMYISKNLRSGEFELYPKLLLPFLRFFHPYEPHLSKHEYDDLKKMYRKKFNDEAILRKVHLMLTPKQAYQLYQKDKSEFDVYWNKLNHSNMTILLNETTIYFHVVELETLD